MLAIPGTTQRIWLVFYPLHNELLFNFLFRIMYKPYIVPFCKKGRYECLLTKYVECLALANYILESIMVLACKKGRNIYYNAVQLLSHDFCSQKYIKMAWTKLFYFYIFVKYCLVFKVSCVLKIPSQVLLNEVSCPQFKISANSFIEIFIRVHNSDSLLEGDTFNLNGYHLVVLSKSFSNLAQPPQIELVVSFQIVSNQYVVVGADIEHESPQSYIDMTNAVYPIVSTYRSPSQNRDISSYFGPSRSTVNNELVYAILLLYEPSHRVSNQQHYIVKNLHFGAKKYGRHRSGNPRFVTVPRKRVNEEIFLPL